MHADTFLRETSEIADLIDRDDVERLALELHKLRERNGRLFVIGLGGSYANAEHAAADLRKLCEIEAYAPNASEMTAYMNDEGAAHAFAGHTKWMTERDSLLVLSVGGGTPHVSPGIVNAIDSCKGTVLGIVGPGGKHTYQHAKVCVRIPAEGQPTITPQAEAFQAVIWHLLVSHPMLQRKPTKW